MDLALLIFRYEQVHGAADNAERRDQLQREIVKVISDDSMSSIYSALCAKFGWEVDQTLASEMRFVGIILTVSQNQILLPTPQLIICFTYPPSPPYHLYGC
jgi:hypothetical protein